MKSKLLKKTRGTNQYGNKYGNLRALIFVVLFSLCLIFIFVNRKVNNTFVTAHINSYDVYAVDNEPTTEPTPTITQNEAVKAYVYDVFGDHADTAFELLACENNSLDPDAVNTYHNTPAGSRDIGVFQINEYWQKTQAKFLFNYKINVEIAYQLYKESGNSFKLWTCGKKLGI